MSITLPVWKAAHTLRAKDIIMDRSDGHMNRVIVSVDLPSAVETPRKVVRVSWRYQNSTSEIPHGFTNYSYNDLVPTVKR